MLVKFLSFIASVLSNARYKAVLIPCIIVVLAITSLTAVALVHEGGSGSAASTAGKTEEKGGEKQPALSPQVSGGAQDTKDDTGQPVADSQASGSNPGGDSADSTSNAPEESAQTNMEIVLSTTAVTIKPDTSSKGISASTSDKSPLTWAVTPETDSATDLQPVPEKEKETAADFSFRFRASQGATAGQYRFVLTAKDASRGINLSKIVIVTVIP